MRISFRCANCSKVTEFGVPTRITLVCQSCGCADITFSNPVLVKPNNTGQDFTGEPILIKQDEPFLGSSPKGNIWSISLYTPPAPSKKDLNLKLRKK